MALGNIRQAHDSGCLYPKGNLANTIPAGEQGANTSEKEVPATLSALWQGIDQFRAVQRSADDLVEQARQEHLGPFIEAIEGVLEKFPSDKDTERRYKEARERLERLLREKELSGKALRAYRKSEYCTDALEDTPLTNELTAKDRNECQQILVATTLDCAIRYQLWGILDLLGHEGPRLGEAAKRAGIESSRITRPVAYVYNDTAPEHKCGSLFITFNNRPDSHVEVEALDPAAPHDNKQTAQDQDGIELSPLAVALCDRIRERLKELGVNGLVKVKLVSYYKGPSRGTTDILLSTELPTANSKQAPSRQPSQLGQAALRGSVYP